MTPLAKRISIVLAVSVALNLLLAGVLAGRAFRHRPPSPEAREEFAARVEGEGRRGPLRGLFREHREELREKRKSIGDARRTARAALEAEPFDRGALERALEALRKETTASQEIMHRAIADAATKGPVEERRKLAGALELANLGGGRGRGPRMKHHDPRGKHDEPRRKRDAPSTEPGAPDSKPGE